MTTGDIVYYKYKGKYLKCTLIGSGYYMCGSNRKKTYFGWKIVNETGESFLVPPKKVIGNLKDIRKHKLQKLES